MRGCTLASIVAVLTAAGAAAAPPAAPPPGHITGIGGIFIQSPNRKALAAWYRDVLGIPVEPWGGTAFATDAPGHPAKLAFTVFSAHGAYMAPSTRDFMIDFAVDDLDAFLARLRAHGVAILKRDDSDPSGSFAWIMDPDGTKIELWQARRPPAPH